jgi:hypothetical protein
LSLDDDNVTKLTQCKRLPDAEKRLNDKILKHLAVPK